jgi:Ca-activated chloride channel homolog
MRAVAIFAVLIGCGTGWAHAQPAVSLEAVTDHKFYRETADSQVYIEARVVPARPAAATAASTRNVVLVLDRSGSMAGEPIAALRAAATAALAPLAPGDIVAVVLFGSEVETLIEAQRRDRIPDLAERLAQIEPAGGAALYDALNQAAAQLRRNAGPATINQIILVTDGPPTKGPREAEDFTRLAELFAGEGTLFSTIGLGPDFNEDTLAAMARVGYGRFRYVSQPGGLAAALQAELAPSATVMGYDAVLTVEFNRVARKVRSHGWRAPSLDNQTLTWHIPRLLSDQPLSLLVSAEIESFQARFGHSAFATVKLRWKQADSGEAQELTRLVPVNFTRESADIRESFDAGVARAAAAATVREGLQKAIEELDRGDPRRALRMLRNARGEARDMNFDLADARIGEMVRRFDAFLAEAQARVLGPSDRKLFRSGMLGEFDPPAKIVEPKN